MRLAERLHAEAGVSLEIDSLSKLPPPDDRSRQGYPDQEAHTEIMVWRDGAPTESVCSSLTWLQATNVDRRLHALVRCGDSKVLALHPSSRNAAWGIVEGCFGRKMPLESRIH